MKRIVLDTNATIPAFFWKGYPQTVYEIVKEGKAKLRSSLKIEAEFVRVLAYSKFGLTPAEILPIVNNLRKYVEFVMVQNKVGIVMEDPTDSIFLECALGGRSDYPISGDHHLLHIRSYKGIQIIRAKDFFIEEGFI